MPISPSPASNYLYYQATLLRLLEPQMPRYMEFFSNLNRLNSLNSLLLKHFKAGTDCHILDVGCGAFAAEMFLPLFADHEVTAFDYTEHYLPIYQQFRTDGHLQNTHFFLADAREVEFEKGRFDLIVMNDIFYEPALDFTALLGKYTAFLKADGMIVFDITNLRTRWIWRLLGKEIGHRRYDLAEIHDISSKSGFDMVEWLPNLGVKGILDKLFRYALWYTFGLANNMTLLIQKRP
jgi:SAM-dependent methyltransferase